jgi:hypothetical protein
MASQASRVISDSQTATSLGAALYDPISICDYTSDEECVTDQEGATDPRRPSLGLAPVSPSTHSPTQLAPVIPGSLWI